MINDTNIGQGDVVGQNKNIGGDQVGRDKIQQLDNGQSTILAQLLNNTERLVRIESCLEELQKDFCSLAEAIHGNGKAGLAQQVDAILEYLEAQKLNNLRRRRSDG